MYELLKVKNMPHKGSNGTGEVSSKEILSIITDFIIRNYPVCEVVFFYENINYNNLRRSFQSILDRNFKNINVSIRGNRIFLWRATNEE